MWNSFDGHAGCGDLRYPRFKDRKRVRAFVVLILVCTLLGGCYWYHHDKGFFIGGHIDFIHNRDHHRR